MASEPVRFIHSGDWQLETPVGGVVEVPAELRESFTEAPYVAAERVTQAAVNHRVDFVLLAGNLLPCESACPYSCEFLLRQFERLAEQQIAVYWLGGEADQAQHWPEQLRLPDNVHRFPSDRLHQIEHRRDGRLVARLCGQSWRPAARLSAHDFAGGGDGIPRIAAVSGKLSKRSLENKGVAYWALGGEPRHQVLLQGASTAVSAGSPQGRRPDDLDAHGAVLVELQADRAEPQLIETDVWRWRRESLTDSDLTSVDGVLEQLNRRLDALPRRSEASRFGWLVVWSIVCRGELAWRLHERALHLRLLESLRKRAEGEGCWTMKIEIEPCEVPSEWTEEDTVLGDFLRAVQRCQDDPEAWLSLAALLPEGPEREELRCELGRAEEDRRRRIWRCVAAWGADLLRGEVELDSAAAIP